MLYLKVWKDEDGYLATLSGVFSNLPVIIKSSSSSDIAHFVDEVMVPNEVRVLSITKNSAIVVLPENEAHDLYYQPETVIDARVGLSLGKTYRGSLV